jgi:hypothetical protein
MRIKPVPTPPDALAEIAAIQRAVPLVPGSEDDCCARLRDRCGLSDRATANDWLAFLRTLGLVRETPRGFVRTDADPTPECVREGLREGVLFAPAALAQLRAASPADPVTPASVFAATRESVPRHDRARNPEWERAWRDRAGRLLRWFALVDLATPVEDRSSSETRSGDGGADADADAQRYVAGNALNEA